MMRRLRTALISSAAALAMVLCARNAAGAAPIRLSIRMQHQLRSSSVPVLLPNQLPRAVGAILSVAIISADRDGYDVGFSVVRNCHGALSCAAVHVSGYASTSRAGRLAPNERSVELPDGSHGVYSPRNCSGASCTQESLAFKRGAASYEIDAKVDGDLPVLRTIYQALRRVTLTPDP